MRGSPSTSGTALRTDGPPGPRPARCPPAGSTPRPDTTPKAMDRRWTRRPPPAATPCASPAPSATARVGSRAGPRPGPSRSRRRTRGHPPPNRPLGQAGGPGAAPLRRWPPRPQRAGRVVLLTPAAWGPPEFDPVRQETRPRRRRRRWPAAPPGPATREGDRRGRQRPGRSTTHRRTRSIGLLGILHFDGDRLSVEPIALHGGRGLQPDAGHGPGAPGRARPLIFHRRRPRGTDRTTPRRTPPLPRRPRGPGCS